jgi:hypothetical protein
MIIHYHTLHRFRERDTAFDFKNCLNDYVKFVERMALAEKIAHIPEGTGVFDGTGGDNDNAHEEESSEYRSVASGASSNQSEVFVYCIWEN